MENNSNINAHDVNTTIDHPTTHTNAKNIESFLIHQNSMIKQYHAKYPKKRVKSENYAVIVEPRSDHKLLEAVCRNVMYFLPYDWNLVVYSHDLSVVKERLKNMDFIFCKTEKSNFTLEEYSSLLMSKVFWNNIPGENILIFQTDSYITRHFTHEYIYMLKQYPFVGAIYRIVNNKTNCKCCPQYYNCNKNIISIDKERNFSMNGGFSFRNKSAMLDCIEKITINDIIEYRLKNGLELHNLIQYEDTYFEDALFLLNYKLPNYNICLKFCTQTIYEYVNSYAIHGLYKNYVYDNYIFHIRPSLVETHDEITEKLACEVKL